MSVEVGGTFGKDSKTGDGDGTEQPTVNCHDFKNII